MKLARLKWPDQNPVAFTQPRSARTLLADLDTLRTVVPEALQRETERAWADLGAALRAVPHDMDATRAAMAAADAVRARVVGAMGSMAG